MGRLSKLDERTLGRQAIVACILYMPPYRFGCVDVRAAWYAYWAFDQIGLSVFVLSLSVAQPLQRPLLQCVLHIIDSVVLEWRMVAHWLPAPSIILPLWPAMRACDGASIICSSVLVCQFYQRKLKEKYAKLLSNDVQNGFPNVTRLFWYGASIPHIAKTYRLGNSKFICLASMTDWMIHVPFGGSATS